MIREAELRRWLLPHADSPHVWQPADQGAPTAPPGGPSGGPRGLFLRGKGAPGVLPGGPSRGEGAGPAPVEQVGQPAAPPIEPARVAWLTGQSSFTHSALSPRQHRVLDDIADDGWVPVRTGFPWTRAAATPKYRATPLALAGPRNAAQGALALEGPHTWFAGELARHLQSLLDATSERLLLLSGSAGWPMLCAALPTMGTPATLRVDVVAIGGVGGSPALPPGWSTHVIRGRRDLLSALGGPREVDRVVPGGHLDAATHPATVRAVLELVESPRLLRRATR